MDLSLNFDLNEALGINFPQPTGRPRFDNGDNGAIEAKGSHKSLGEVLYEQRSLGFMTDVTLLVRPNENGRGQVELFAHKLVLMGASPVISTYLEHPWITQGQRPVVELPIGINLNSIEKFLKALYTERVENNLDVETLLDILFLADHYDVGYLIFKVDEKLLEKVVPEISTRVFEHAKHFCGLRVHNKAFGMIVGDIKNKLESEECLFWSKTLWKKLLKLNYLKEVEEIELFKSLLAWKEEEPESRSAAFTKLFPLIRLPLIGAADFSKYVLPSDLLSQDEVAKYFKFYSGSDCFQELEVKPRNLIQARNSQELYCAVEDCESGDVIQLSETTYSGHFCVKVPKTIIRGHPGGNTILEFGSCQSCACFYVAPSALGTRIENIKFRFKGPEKSLGIGVDFRFSDSVHWAKNLEMECGSGPVIRVFGSSGNLNSENILGEILVEKPSTLFSGFEKSNLEILLQFRP